VLVANTLNNQLYNVEVICGAVGAESGIWLMHERPVRLNVVYKTGTLA
jgi:hypothetical protein